jgi:hypothetical protein
MITCRRVTALHTDARDGALGVWDRLRYAFHMRLCGSCQAYRDGLDQTRAALRDLAREEARAPDALRAALAARVREKGRAGEE